MNAREITAALMFYYNWRKNIILPNSQEGTVGWEADLLIVRPSGWAEEVEVKISKSDFLADMRKKPMKHRTLVKGKPVWIHRPHGNVDQQVLQRYLSALEHKGNIPQTFPGEHEPHAVYDYREAKPHICKKFWFAMPIKLAEEVAGEIPEHAGLLAIQFQRVVIIKPAPALKLARKMTDGERIKVLTLVHRRYHLQRIREASNR